MRVGTAVLAVLLAGTDAAAEPPAEEAVPDVLVSRQLAAGERLAVGDVVTLATDAGGRKARRFRVAGIYEPVPDPMRFTARRLEVRLHLPDLLVLAAEPSAPEGITAVNVALTDPTRAEDVAREIAARAPSVIARPARGRGEPFVVLERFHQAISAVTMLGSTAFLLALMVIRAEERRSLAGILLLVGLRRRRVLGQALLEGVLLALAGAAFGVALAAGTEDLVNAFFQWRYDTTLVFVRVTPEIAVRCVLVAVPLGALAGLLASLALVRRPVLELLGR